MYHLGLYQTHGAKTVNVDMIFIIRDGIWLLLVSWLVYLRTVTLTTMRQNREKKDKRESQARLCKLAKN